MKRVDIAFLNAEAEMRLTNFNCFCSVFQSEEAADWKDERPMAELVLGF